MMMAEQYLIDGELLRSLIEYSRELDDSSERVGPTAMLEAAEDAQAIIDAGPVGKSREVIERKKKVVIRYIPTLSRWYVCHAKTYQNAIGSKNNGTATRGEAVALAESAGYEVVWHQQDKLQKL